MGNVNLLYSTGLRNLVNALIMCGLYLQCGEPNLCTLSTDLGEFGERINHAWVVLPGYSEPNLCTLLVSGIWRTD